MNKNGCNGNDRADNDQIRFQMESLTPEDLASLAAYAHRRLQRIGMDGSLAEDIAQDALQAIMVGLYTPIDGRHPRPCDVASHGAFVEYLGGVVNSMVAYERSKRIHQFTHEPLVTDPGHDEHKSHFAELRSDESVVADVCWNDLQDVFFARIRPRAVFPIQPILIDWERVWQWSSQIPVPIPQRRFRRHVKRLAQEVLGELGEALAA